MILTKLSARNPAFLSKASSGFQRKQAAKLAAGAYRSSGLKQVGKIEGHPPFQLLKVEQGENAGLLNWVRIQRVIWLDSFGVDCVHLLSTDSFPSYGDPPAGSWKKA